MGYRTGDRCSGAISSRKWKCIRHSALGLSILWNIVKRDRGLRSRQPRRGVMISTSRDSCGQAANSYLHWRVLSTFICFVIAQLQYMNNSICRLSLKTRHYYYCWVVIELEFFFNDNSLNINKMHAITTLVVCAILYNLFKFPSYFLYRRFESFTSDCYLH